MIPTQRQLQKYSREDLATLKERIETSILERDGKIATLQPKHALFDTSSLPDVFSVEIDNKTLTDFQTLQKAEGEDIRNTICALIEYYSNHDSLNLLLTQDVLESRQSYIKFTAQLANYIRNHIAAYQQVKVAFDPRATRLGIFCRRGTTLSSLNQSFIGAITGYLHVHDAVHVPLADIPMSYLGNRAALKHMLKQRMNLPNPASLRIIWNDKGVTVHRK